MSGFDRRVQFPVLDRRRSVCDILDKLCMWQRRPCGCLADCKRLCVRVPAVIVGRINSPAAARHVAVGQLCRFNRYRCSTCTVDQRTYWTNLQPATAAEHGGTTAVAGCKFVQYVHCLCRRRHTSCCCYSHHGLSSVGKYYVGPKP